MNVKTRHMYFAIVLLAACGGPGPQSAGPVADLLLVNAEVVTVRW